MPLKLVPHHEGRAAETGSQSEERAPGRGVQSQAHPASRAPESAPWNMPGKKKASSRQDETEQPAGRERVPEGGRLSTGCARVRTTQGRVCGGVRGARRPAASGARVKPPATPAPVFQMQARSHRLIGPATLQTSLASTVLQECPVAG